MINKSYKFLCVVIYAAILGRNIQSTRAINPVNHVPANRNQIELYTRTDVTCI